MCNDYEQHIRYAEYSKAMRDLALNVPSHQSDADLPQADDIRIGDLGPVLRAGGNGVELAQMRFGFPPEGRRKPVFNFRSEGRDFSGSQRCLVLASAFFEFKGTTYPKAKYRFTLAGSAMMAIAGLWRNGEGNQTPAFAMLTTDPGPDVAPIHDRQVVVLGPENWADWIYFTKAGDDLLAPPPAGSLRVQQVRAGSG